MCNLESYQTKTTAELLFILRDAREASENMRGFDVQAELKYLDQINDACTVLHRRKLPLLPEAWEAKL